jgi:hypothetical protein
MAIHSSAVRLALGRQLGTVHRSARLAKWVPPSRLSRRPPVAHAADQIDGFVLSVGGAGLLVERGGRLGTERHSWSEVGARAGSCGLRS